MVCVSPQVNWKKWMQKNENIFVLLSNSNRNKYQAKTKTLKNPIYLFCVLINCFDQPLENVFFMCRCFSQQISLIKKSVRFCILFACTIRVKNVDCLPLAALWKLEWRHKFAYSNFVRIHSVCCTWLCMFATVWM